MMAAPRVLLPVGPHHGKFLSRPVQRQSVTECFQTETHNTASLLFNDEHRVDVMFLWFWHRHAKCQNPPTYLLL